MPKSTAFYPQKGEPYTSVNWLEFLGLSTRAEEIAAVRALLIAKAFTPRRTGRHAVLNVGDITRGVETQSEAAPKVTHQPDLPLDPSHTGLFYPSNDLALIEFLATRIAEKVIETHPGV